MLKLQLARADNDDFYLALPATPADIGEVWSWMDEISTDVASTRIVGAISDVWGIGKYLKSADVNDPEQLKKLNRIGEIVNGLPGEKYRLLEGTLKAESVNSLDDVIDIGEHLERYLLIEGVASDRELGGYLVGYGIMPFDERVRPYSTTTASGGNITPTTAVLTRPAVMSSGGTASSRNWKRTASRSAG